VVAAPIRGNMGRNRGECLACEAVVSKGKCEANPLAVCALCRNFGFFTHRSAGGRFNFPTAVPCSPRPRKRSALQGHLSFFTFWCASTRDAVKLKPMAHEPHSPLSELSLEAIIALLHSRGLRVTKGRQKILETLLQATEPLSLEEIQHRSVVDGVTPDYATVFRVMAMLEELHVAQRVLLNRSCSYFELLDPQQHYDHLICTQCGRVTLMVDSCPVEKVEQAIGKRYGFTDVRHSLEFFGKCPECR
jgi:Fur family ferric uptake transcriptional regulator